MFLLPAVLFVDGRFVKEVSYVGLTLRMGSSVKGKPGVCSCGLAEESVGCANLAMVCPRETEL